jgi:hypothetical protein
VRGGLSFRREAQRVRRIRRVLRVSARGVRRHVFRSVRSELRQRSHPSVASAARDRTDRLDRPWVASAAHVAETSSRCFRQPGVSAQGERGDVACLSVSSFGFGRKLGFGATVWSGSFRRGGSSGGGARGCVQRQEGTDAGDGARLREGSKALEGERTPGADLARNKASRHGADRGAERSRKPEGAGDAARQTASTGRCRVRGDAEGATNLMGGADRTGSSAATQTRRRTAARSLEDSEGERKPMGGCRSCGNAVRHPRRAKTLRARR